MKAKSSVPGFVIGPGIKTPIPRQPDVSVNFNKCCTYVTVGPLLSGCSKGVNNMVLKPVFSGYTAEPTN